MEILQTTAEPSVWKDLDQWRTFMAARYPGVKIQTSLTRQPFCTQYRAWQCGEVEFAEIQSSTPLSLQVVAPEAAAQDAYYFPLQLAGGFRGGQAGRECQAGPGTMMLLDSRVPHWRELSPGSRLLNIRLPKSVLAPHLLAPQKVCVQPVRGDAGKGAVAWGFLTSLWQQQHALDSADLVLLSDLVARMVAGVLADGVPLAPQPRVLKSAGHLRCLLAYLHEHGDDPDLSVGQAAAACGISPRYIHVLMQGTGKTFSRYLLDYRLEQSHRRLADPRQGAASITEIAFACGFNDGAHFSRAFRGRYGVSPREFRKSHQ